MTFNLNVSYKGKKTVAETTAEPVIRFPKKDGMFYTILMYDPDAPVGTWLHMLKMNVSSGNIHGDVVASYVGPSPPAGSGLGPQGTHRYITSVYEQHGYVSPLPTFTTRGGFSEKRFLETYGLRHLTSATFTVDASPTYGGRKKRTIRRRHRLYIKKTRREKKHRST